MNWLCCKPLRDRTCRPRCSARVGTAAAANQPRSCLGPARCADHLRQARDLLARSRMDHTAMARCAMTRGEAIHLGVFGQQRARWAYGSGHALDTRKIWRKLGFKAATYKVGGLCAVLQKRMDVFDFEHHQQPPIGGSEAIRVTEFARACLARKPPTTEGSSNVIGIKEPGHRRLDLPTRPWQRKTRGAVGGSRARHSTVSLRHGHYTDAALVARARTAWSTTRGAWCGGPWFRPMRRARAGPWTPGGPACRFLPTPNLDQPALRLCRGSIRCMMRASPGWGPSPQWT